MNLLGSAFSHQDQGLDETVHPGEERHPFGSVGPHHLERASRVDGAVVGHAAPERIADLGLDFLRFGVLAVHPDSGH